jgi:hypothetical protein
MNDKKGITPPALEDRGNGRLSALSQKQKDEIISKVKEKNIVDSDLEEGEDLFKKISGPGLGSR